MNRWLTGAFDLLLLPLRGLPPVVGIAILSLGTSVGMLLVFKATSNQDRLARAKQLLHAGVYEIRLFRDDARAIVRAQLDILKQSLRYFGLSLPPLLWMLIPFFLLVAQLQFRYAYAGLEPGQQTIVKAQLAGDRLPEALSLDPGPGIAQDAPLLWIPTTGEANWRIVVTEPGSHAVRVEAGGQAYEKGIDATGGIARRSPVRPSASLLEQLVYPVEEPLPGAAAVRRITVEYPEFRVSLLGWEMHWLVAFLIFTFGFTLILRKPMKVTI